MFPNSGEPAFDEGAENSADGSDNGCTNAKVKVSMSHKVNKSPS